MFISCLSTNISWLEWNLFSLKINKFHSISCWSTKYRLNIIYFLLLQHQFGGYLSIFSWNHAVFSWFHAIFVLFLGFNDISWSNIIYLKYYLLVLYHQIFHTKHLFCVFFEQIEPILCVLHLFCVNFMLFFVFSVRFCWKSILIWWWYIIKILFIFD